MLISKSAMNASLAGSCWCYKNAFKSHEMTSDWKYVTCSLDSPNKEIDLMFESCEADRDRGSYPCTSAMDDSWVGQGNAWTYLGKGNAWIKLTLKADETAYISKVKLLAGRGVPPKRLGKFRLKFNVGGQGWTVPNNIRGTTEEAFFSVDDKGTITMLGAGRDYFEVTFDPIDAFQVQLVIIESISKTKSVMLNEIRLVKAGNICL